MNKIKMKRFTVRSLLAVGIVSIGGLCCYAQESADPQVRAARAASSVPSDVPAVPTAPVLMNGRLVEMPIATGDHAYEAGDRIVQPPATPRRADPVQKTSRNGNMPGSAVAAKAMQPSMPDKSVTGPPTVGRPADADATANLKTGKDPAAQSASQPVSTELNDSTRPVPRKP